MMYFFVLFCFVLFVCIFFMDKCISSYHKRKKRVENVCLYFQKSDVEFIEEKTFFHLILSASGSFLFRLKLFNESYIDRISKNKSSKNRYFDYNFFVGLKILLFILFLFLSVFICYYFNINGFYKCILFFLFGCVGFFIPDFVLSKKRQHHLVQVDLGMADALDLLLVCAEAGLAMEAALECVATETIKLNRDISEEFRITLDEMRVGNDRVKILEDLGRRTGSEAMQRLSVALVQTFETGSSLASVLRVLVSELREDSLTKFEEKAARLSVILTFPMILFLLPCMFIVIAGPALLNVLGVLRN
ncbi:type II secretion system F family protein [Acetobacter conturbans]|nr:type II secretion system F family protein [Acetobacter conturbans]